MNLVELNKILNAAIKDESVRAQVLEGVNTLIKDARYAKDQAEEELLSSTMILSGSVAHDLRTPIASVRLIGEILNRIMPNVITLHEEAKKSGLPSAALFHKRELEFIQRTGGTLLDIVNTMSDFIEVTLKTLKNLAENNLNPKDLVLCSYDKCASKAFGNYPFMAGDEQKFHWDRSHDFEFMGNEIIMIRILHNLLKHSLEQIREIGKGEVYVTVESQPQHNIIHFRNTAGGIAPDKLAHIFEVTYDSQAESTGMGLAFCKKMMNFFGGDITCRSDGDSVEFCLVFLRLDR